jgi:hypothetical protein
MTKSTRLLFMLFLMCISIGTSEKPLLAQTNEVKRAEMREKIGLDMTVPDFETKRIDANVMGIRLAGILNYLIENYQQGVYDRKLGRIAGEQNEALENAYIQIKKIKLLNAVKKGNEITIIMRADLQKNAIKVKQADITFHFINGISESDMVNEMFSYISHYVQARELLEN